MNLTEEEKKVFGIKDDEKVSNPVHYIDEGILLRVYDVNINDEMKHKLEVTLGYIKRQILEVAKKKDYNIRGDESFDVDELLVEVSSSSIFKEDSDTLLVNFDSSNYKNSKKMNNYFYQLTDNMSWEEVKKVCNEVSLKNDEFRILFANYVPHLLRLTGELYNELEKDKNKAFDSTFDNNDKNKWDDNEQIDDEEDEWDFSEDEWEIEEDDRDKTSINVNNKEEDLSEENLKDYMRFINTVPELMQYRNLGIEVGNKLLELSNQKKLEDFYSNEEFSNAFDNIMDHDENERSYYFHGTSDLESAGNILEQGLLMMRKDLSSTSYREFSKDEVLLYKRGLAGEIGNDAVVIIDVPKDENGAEIDIVKNNNREDVNFIPSGLQGLNGRANYIVLPENIVGYVDKQNQQVIFNPNYREYDRFVIDEEKMR